MKNTAATRYAVAHFPLPPFAPEAVREAEGVFDRVADRFGELQGERQDSRDELKQAQAADRQVMAQAPPKAGSPAKQHDRHERAAVAHQTRLEAELAAASEATDEAGNALAQAIGENRDAWADALGQAEETAYMRARAAMAELQDAVTDLGQVRRALEWLAELDVQRAIAGQETPFTGGALRTDLGLGLNGSQTVARLPEIVGEALAPAEPARPCTHVEAR